MGPRILAVSGSGRQGSLNSMSLAVACEGIKAAGGDVTLLDLNHYPIPIYNGDLEAAQGLPSPVKAIKKLLFEHQGLLIATPEYNSSYTPLLKNMVDWTSRAESDETPLQAYKHLKIALISASPGGYGGVRSVTALRLLLENCALSVIEASASIGKAHEQFDETGRCINEDVEAQLKSVGAALADAVNTACVEM